MLKYYGLPFWVVGVIASFALSFVPHWGMWLAAALVLLAASRRFAVAGMMLCVLLGAAYGVFRTEAALSSQWPLNGASESVLTVEVADMPRGDGRRVQFAAKAWTEDGRQFDLLLSDYQKRDWAVGSRWKVSARLKPVIGEVNLRGLNREAWALANGLDGAGTLGKGRSLVREGGGVGLAVWRDAVSRRWQAVGADSPDFSDGIGLMRALSIGEQSALRSELWQAFRPLGLTHLVSISGLHVTM
ncbi:MAG: ComEC family DNA internalization-related competence protein, partial [Neisseria sp.]|nr:ComEC family DNA internalization-related competence protein [Neisseria sp.]